MRLNDWSNSKQAAVVTASLKFDSDMSIPLFAPAMLVPQPRDLCQVVINVPSVAGQSFSERNDTIRFRVKVPLFQLVNVECPDEFAPARVNPLQDRQRTLNGRRSCVNHFRPQGFVIRLDPRSLFGQRPFKSNVAIEMTVGEMMNDLPNRPVAVLRI